MNAHAHEHHGIVTYDKAFLIATIANGIFVVFQIFMAFKANSTSLLADAFHNLGDVLSLILAWVATFLMKLKPTDTTTYGLKKLSILAALINGLILVFTCGIIATEAFYKFFSQAEIHTTSVILVATVGIIINSTTALLFKNGSKDLNIRGAYLHLFYDALISLGVVVSAIIMYFTDWFWIDPLVGLLIALIILKGTWSLFMDSFRLLIDGVPKNISWNTISDFLLTIPGVQGIHDLHIWALSTTENALSVHLYMPEEAFTDKSRALLVEKLRDIFSIQHVTIQIEKTDTDCIDTCHNPISH